MNFRSPVFYNLHLLCFSALCISVSCSKTQPELSVKEALTVELISPSFSDWPEVIDATGFIEPWQESIVSVEVGDLKLKDVLVNVGDHVSKGQLLARLDSEIPSADLLVAEASVAQMEAAFFLAQEKAASARRLDGTGTISREEILQYEAEEKSSLAQLASAKAILNRQQSILKHTEVRSPDDGVISSRSATIGAVTNSGIELFRLIRQNRLEWRALVPSENLYRIGIGQRVVLDLDGEQINGIVRQVSPIVDPGTLNGVVYVDLPDCGVLRAGMFVSGQIEFQSRPAFHLPESTIVYRDGFQYVMTVDDANKVHQLKVMTGRRNEQAVEILGDKITLNHRVVFSGSSFLNEGDSVLTVQDQKGVVQ